jgi:hypothetical protein
MVDSALSQTIKEAYASAPSGVVILDTLELRHPDFVDELDVVTAIRVVQNYEDEQSWLDIDQTGVAAVLDNLSDDERRQVGLVAALEADAPVDAGQLVPWVAMSFEMTKQPVDTSPVPEIEVVIDNVGREIIRHLDAAAESQHKIEITYRAYLSNDITGPQNDPPLTMTLYDVDVDVFKIHGRARILDAGIKAFPNQVYTAKKYPSLGR